MPKSKYPANEGWLKVTLTLTKNAPVGEDECKELVTFGKPGDHEFGSIVQNGKKIIAFTRHKSLIPASA